MQLLRGRSGFVPLRSNGTSAEQRSANRMRRFARSIPGGNPILHEPTGSFCLAFGAEADPRFAPLRSNGTSAEQRSANRMRRFARSIPGGSTASAQGCNVRRFVPRGLTQGLRLLFPHICCASVWEPYFSRALGLFFVWLSVRKQTRGSPHCAAMAQKAKRRQFSMRRGMFKPRRGWRRWAPFSPPSRRGRRSPQRR